MKRIDRIQAKIKQIESICKEVISELDLINKEQENLYKKSIQKGQKGTSLISEDECRTEFDKLYKEFLAGNPKAVEEFVKEKTMDYLKIFCKANSLSIDIKKVSKEDIINEILQWLAQRKAIIGEVSSQEVGL